MSVIAVPYTFSPGIARSAEVNANFSEIQTKFNATAVQTDVAKTITAVHTFAANVLFTDNLYDIGAPGAARPRNLHLAGTATIGGAVSLSSTLMVTGAASANGGFSVNNGNIELSSAATQAVAMTGAGLNVGTRTAHTLLLITNNVVAVTIAATGLVSMGGGLTLTAGYLTLNDNYGGGTNQVTAGAIDSAGTGFRLLRSPN